MNDARVLAPFENHLQFLARHRGDLRYEGDSVWIVGADDEFTTWTPWSESARVPESCTAVRVPPIESARWEKRLASLGFEASERLSYMEFTDDPAIWALDPERVGIEVVRSEEGARQFAAVQAEGFRTGAAAVDQWWRAFFLETALRNRLDQEQTFYLARVGVEPAGVTLALRTHGLTGVYAVATRPGFRNRGLARALLAQACADAHTHRMSRVILQAMKGSYAEGMYRRLGFRTLYELSVWRRPGSWPERGVGDLT